jgi:hypothetical protein
MREWIKYAISFTPAIVVVLLVIAVGDIAFVGFVEIYSKSNYCCFGEAIMFWFIAVFLTVVYIVASTFFVSFAVFVAKDIRKGL